MNTPHNLLPIEQLEKKISSTLLMGSPLWIAIGIPLIDRYIKSFLYLQPIPANWSVIESYRHPVAWALVIGIFWLLIIWRVTLSTFFKAFEQRRPLAAIVSLMILAGFCAVLEIPKARWLFVEWAIPRTPLSSFARNTLFWEQRNFEQSGQGTLHVGLVGSSQTYQGFDLELLSRSLPNCRFEKNCLAGFGPIQYSFHYQKISERNHDVVVCHLSEFDFYREDSIPVSRLRWGANLEAVFTLCQNLSTHKIIEGRSDLADLIAASVYSPWRNKEHFKRVFSQYWWNSLTPVATGTTTDAKGSQPTLATSPELLEAIAFLKRNIGEKELVETNFKSFESFAIRLKEDGKSLIVIEGAVHPRARQAYDKEDLQAKTRERLTEMAQRIDFRYIPSSRFGAMDEAHFSDAYHLNDKGRQTLSLVLVDILKVHSPGHKSL